MLIQLHKNITAYPVGNMAMMMYMQVCIHCLFCRAKIESFSTRQNFICPNYFSKRGKIPVLGYCSYGIFRLILSRFFIGYWILKRGWISILAPLFFLEGKPQLTTNFQLRTILTAPDSEGNNDPEPGIAPFLFAGMPPLENCFNAI